MIPLTCLCVEDLSFNPEDFLERVRGVVVLVAVFRFVAVRLFFTISTILLQNFLRWKNQFLEEVSISSVLSMTALLFRHEDSRLRCQRVLRQSVYRSL